MKKFLLIAALLSFLAVGVVWVSVPNKSDSEKARNGKEVKNILCADCNVILLSVDSLRAHIFRTQSALGRSGVAHSPVA
ncbi:MAG: hypothetical protein AAB819_01925 [Patescibacteria group bacterium]